MKAVFFIVFLFLVLVSVPASVAQDCLLTVPPNPLTAVGLATPYTVTAVDPTNPCDQADVGTFVQGAILDLETGASYVYNPLVIDKGTTAATAPVVPNLPQAYVAALWFGTNGGSLTLVDSGGSLSAGQCVNGLTGSIFGQVAYCNSPAFFASANFLINQGMITVPPLTNGKDGMICPTTHSFFLVDQDQSDNVVTTYLMTTTGKFAQDTVANRKKYPGYTVISNGSDERLLTLMNAGLGCPDYNVSDLADPGANLPSVPFNEIQALYTQSKPIAFVPVSDPMVVNTDGSMNIKKVNAYRIGMGQPLIATIDEASPAKYCSNIANTFATRMGNAETKKLLTKQPSPDPAMATNLYLFLAQRFVAAYQILNCTALIGAPVCITVNAPGGVATSMTINPALIPPAADDDSSDGVFLKPSPVSMVVAALVALLMTRFHRAA